MVATYKSQEKRWGPSCQCYAQSIPHPEQIDSNWSEEDWDGEIKKAKEKEKQIKEEELKQKLAAEEHRATTTYYPLSPQYNSADEEDPPTLRELPPEPTMEGHSDYNRIEEDNRKMLELLNEKFDFRLLFWIGFWFGHRLWISNACLN